MLLDENEIRQQYYSTAASPILKGRRLPFPIRYVEEDQIKAILSDGTKLIFNEDYTVEVVDDNSEIPEEEKINLKNYANVVLAIDIPIGETITLYRETALDQTSEFPQEGRFNSRKIEDALDKLTMQNQEQRESLSRALKLPLTASKDITELSLPNPEPLKSVKWNADGSALINTKYDPDEAFGELEGVVVKAQTHAEEAKTYADDAKTSTEEVQNKIEKFDKESEEVFLRFQQEKEEANRVADELREVIVQGVGQPIGTIYPLICSPEYIPEGSHPCNGAEYKTDQFESFYNNYLKKKKRYYDFPWTQPTVYTTWDWDRVRFINNKFFFTGGNNNIASSTDGIILNTSTVSPARWRDIAYGNGMYIAVGTAGYMTTSSDGAYWTEGVVISDNILEGIVFKEDRFIAVGVTAEALVSTDGSSWEKYAIAGVSSTVRFYNICLGEDGLIVAVGTTGYICTSQDGYTWTSQQVGSGNWYSVTYANGTYIAVGDNGSKAVSKNGVNWKYTDAPDFPVTWKGITYGNDRFMMIGSGTYYSESFDGEVWTTPVRAIEDTSVSYIANSITYGNNYFVSCGTKGSVITKNQYSEETSLLNSCSYDKYNQDMDVYGQCIQFATKTVVETKADCSNDSLSFITEQKAVEDTTLTYYKEVYPDGSVSCDSRIIMEYPLSITFSLIYSPSESTGKGYILFQTPRAALTTSLYSFEGSFSINYEDIDSKQVILSFSDPEDWGLMPGANEDLIWIENKAIYYRGEIVDYVPVEKPGISPERHTLSVKGAALSSSFDISIVIDNGVNTTTYDLGKYAPPSTAGVKPGFMIGHSPVTTDPSSTKTNVFKGKFYLSDFYRSSTALFSSLSGQVKQEGWKSAEGQTVLLSDFGVEILSGTPENGDTLHIYSDTQSYFKLPYIKDGAVIQQALSNSELGKVYNEGLPNIEGSWSSGSGGPTTGAVYIDGDQDGEKGGSGGVDDKATFNASLYDSTYGATDDSSLQKVQMNAVALRYFVVIANGAINKEDMDWAEWATSLETKIDKKDLAEIPVVIERYVGENSWYDLYSDGLCVQGGKFTYVANGTIYLLKTYRDINYYILITDVDQADTGGIAAASAVASWTENSVTLSTTSEANFIFWETRGYVN